MWLWWTEEVVLAVLPFDVGTQLQPGMMAMWQLHFKLRSAETAGRLRGLTCIACVARAIHVPGLDRGTFSNFLQTWYNCYILLQLVSSKRWQDERFNRSHCLQRGKIIDQFQLWLWESRFDFRFICFSLRCRSWASQLQVDHDPP